MPRFVKKEVSLKNFPYIRTHEEWEQLAMRRRKWKEGFETKIHEKSFEVELTDLLGISHVTRDVKLEDILGDK